VLPPKKCTKKQLISALETLIDTGQRHERGLLAALPHPQDYRAGFTEVKIPYGLLVQVVKLLKGISKDDPTGSTRKNGKR
jgi:hypothetical protein